MGADYYERAQICENGHVQTSSFSSTDAEVAYCPECGARTITSCPHCGKPIRGHGVVVGVIALSHYQRPSYCHACGKPYPWTERALSRAEQIADAAKLSVLEKNEIVSSLEQIAADSPEAKASAEKIRAASDQIGGILGKSLIEIAAGAGSKVVEKLLLGI